MIPNRRALQDQVDSRLAQQSRGCYHDPVRFETKFPLKLLQRRRRSKRLHSNHVARCADVSLPSERRGLLNRDPRLDAGGQHAVPVFLRLVLEDLPRGHGDDTRPDALGEQLGVGLHRKTQLAPPSTQDPLRIPTRRTCEHEAPPRHPPPATPRPPPPPHKHPPSNLDPRLSAPEPQ